MLPSVPLLPSSSRSIRETDDRAHDSETFWSVPDLRSRGWTDTMIRRLLDDPDRRRPNPYYRSAAPMRLYRITRVEEMERSTTFVTWAGKAVLRSARAKAVAERKAQELLGQVATMQIVVPRLDVDRLRDKAIAQYNQRQQERTLNGRRETWQDVEPASPASSPVFLERITVNYVRHRLTSYDRNLERVAGQIGVAQAVTAIRKRIYAAIAETYPHLALECERQLARRLGSLSSARSTTSASADHDTLTHSED